MLGDSVMVAPMVAKGTMRMVRFPSLKNGVWKGSDGKIYEGSRLEMIKAPMDSLAFFEIANKK